MTGMNGMHMVCGTTCTTAQNPTSALQGLKVPQTMNDTKLDSKLS